MVARLHLISDKKPEKTLCGRDAFANESAGLQLFNREQKEYKCAYCAKLLKKYKTERNK